MKALKLGLLAIWQLPQNVAGALVLLLVRPVRASIEVRQAIVFVKVRKFAITLGQFVFWTDQDLVMVPTLNDNRQHEFGHTLQSRWLGPFYLPVVGLPSLTRNVYAAYYFCRHKTRWGNYYKGFPEDWADRLAGRS